MNLNDPKERFFDAKLRRIEGPDALIVAMKNARRDHPEIERVTAFTRSLNPERPSRLMHKWYRESRSPWTERWRGGRFAALPAPAQTCAWRR
jgi:hypothetical protein